MKWKRQINHDWRAKIKHVYMEENRAADWMANWASKNNNKGKKRT